MSDNPESPATDTFEQDFPDKPLSPLAPQTGPGGYRIVPPGTEVGTAPGVGEYLLSALKTHWPDAAAMAATTALPQVKLLGPLLRAATGGAVRGEGQALQNMYQGTTADPVTSGALFAGGQLAGEGLAHGVTGLFNSALTSKYVRDRMAALGTYLTDTIPALKGFEATPDGVRKMFYSQEGYNAVHGAYDDAMKDVVARGSTVDLVLMESAARALRIPIKGAVGPVAPPSPLAGPAESPLVAVNAADAATAAQGMWRKHPAEYGAVMDALDQAGVGDPAARQAYRVFSGVKNFLDRSGIFSKETWKVQPEKFAGGFVQQGKAKDLLQRNLEADVRALLVPGDTPVAKTTLAVPGMIAGGLTGASGLGSMFPGLGHVGGAAGGGYLGHRIGGQIPYYTNLPTPGLLSVLQRMLGGATGAVSAGFAPEDPTP